MSLSFISCNNLESDPEKWAGDEASYRRGYQQGAHATLKALRAAGIKVPCEITDWVGDKLHDWRFHGVLESMELPPDAPLPRAKTSRQKSP